MKKLLLLISCLVLTAVCFCGCFPAEETHYEYYNDDERQETFYTVTFDTDGGTPIPNQTVMANEKVIKPQNPKKQTTVEGDYEFLGWFVADVEWNFAVNTVNSNLVIKAKYKVEKNNSPQCLPSE